MVLFQLMVEVRSCKKNSSFLKFTRYIVIEVANFFWIGILLNQLPTILASDKACKCINYPINYVITTKFKQKAQNAS